MSETKIAAYKDLHDPEKSPDLGRQQEAVYKCIKKEAPVTRNELDRMLGFRRSSICGRVNELMEKELVKEVGVTVDADTGKKVAQLNVIKCNETAHETKAFRVE